jgi:hypothetical protein
MVIGDSILGAGPQGGFTWRNRFSVANISSQSYSMLVFLHCCPNGLGKHYWECDLVVKSHHG